MLPNGKVSSEKTTNKTKVKKERKNSTSRSSVKPTDEKVTATDEKERDCRPTTTSSIGRCIDEIFEVTLGSIIRGGSRSVAKCMEERSYRKYYHIFTL